MQRQNKPGKRGAASPCLHFKKPVTKTRRFLPMTTYSSTHKSMFIRAAGVALLLLAGVLTPHTATAQSSRSFSDVRVTFTYHPDESAEAIYAHLQATARDACIDQS